jgi:hypothetical protein
MYTYTQTESLCGKNGILESPLDTAKSVGRDSTSGILANLCSSWLFAAGSRGKQGD